MMEQWDNVLLCSLFVSLRFKGGTKAKDPGGGAAQLWGIGLSAELWVGVHKVWGAASLAVCSVPGSQPVLEHQLHGSVLSLVR